MPKPTAEEQVAFLRNLQRLLGEGQFVSTYKFGLLLALADLCIEFGDDSGDQLAIPVAAIAEKFLAIYWTHTNPFPVAAPEEPAVLYQNLGPNIAILKRIEDVRRAADTIALARKSADWRSLRTKTSSIVRSMPLLRLQTLRGAGAITFLYRNQVENGSIQLLPGVAFNFRRFYGLVQHIVRGAWLGHVRANPRNAHLLGEATDLEEFLFGSSRAQYPLLKTALHKLQDGKCFYCEEPVGRAGELDHFIPWSKYPTDLGHNFVLADRKCNANKSQLLAEPRFLEKWRERNASFGKVISEACERAAVPNDLPSSERVAVWAYAFTESSKSTLWRPGMRLQRE